jgi:hypothetical protein
MRKSFLRSNQLLVATVCVGSMFWAGNVAAQSAGQDMKNAGHETSDAAKDTGHGVKEGTTKAYHSTAHGTQKAYHKTAHGTQKAYHKTAQGTTKAYHATGHAIEHPGEARTAQPPQ